MQKIIALLLLTSSAFADCSRTGGECLSCDALANQAQSACEGGAAPGERCTWTTTRCTMTPEGCGLSVMGSCVCSGVR